MDESDRAGRFGGTARLPIALAGLLLVVAVGLVALVAVGSQKADEMPGPVAESGVEAEDPATPARDERDVPGRAGQDDPGSAPERAAGHDDPTEPAHADAGSEPAQRPSEATERRDTEESALDDHSGQPAAATDDAPPPDAPPPDAPPPDAPPPDAPNADAPNAESATAGPSAARPQMTPQGPAARTATDEGQTETSGREAAPASPPEQAAPSEQAAPRTDQLASLPPPPPMPDEERRGLPPAPDPSLVEPSPEGPLPRVGPDGRQPWQAYARPFDAREDRPRVAIIVSGLGLSSAATEAAIQGLPSEVTLAFQPFADNLQQWIRLARAAGHEVLLNLPMEPVDYPESDPGPKALFVTLSPEENIDRLRWALSRVSGYVGVLNHMGSRFTTSREAMDPILDELKDRGLLFVDARSSARSVATILASERRVPRAINDRFLDAREVSRANVDARLEEVVRIAEEAGVSVAIGQAFPVTIERIREWTDSLDRSRIVLAPISAVVDRQGDR